MTHIEIRENEEVKFTPYLDINEAPNIVARLAVYSDTIARNFGIELKLDQPKMQVQGLSLSIWLEECFSILRRVYVDIPEFEDVIYGCGWAPRSRMSVALKFASRYSGLKSLNYSFYKNATIRDEVFKMLEADKEGLDVSPTPPLHDWLHQEGFSTDEEIEELVIVSGGRLYNNDCVSST